MVVHGISLRRSITLATDMMITTVSTTTRPSWGRRRQSVSISFPQRRPRGDSGESSNRFWTIGGLAFIS